MVNGSITKKELKNKYVFWDIDGTLAPYRFNGHTGDPDGTNNGMSLNEIEAGVFLLRAPSRHMQDVIKSCDAKEHIIMGHCQVEKEMHDKQIWLDTHYPMIILEYCQKHNINLSDVIFVDDVIRFLQEAERKGIKSFHISSFLDWNYQKE